VPPLPGLSPNPPGGGLSWPTQRNFWISRVIKLAVNEGVARATGSSSIFSSRKKEAWGWGADQVARNVCTCTFRAKYEVSSSKFQCGANSKIQWFLFVETD
jgi:hypothetical protein